MQYLIHSYFCWKMWVAFANAKTTHIFFCKNISIYAISKDQSFNNTLTNDIFSFEQLGPEVQRRAHLHGANLMRTYKLTSKRFSTEPTNLIKHKNWYLVPDKTQNRNHYRTTILDVPYVRLIWLTACKWERQAHRFIWGVSAGSKVRILIALKLLLKLLPVLK